MKRLSYLFFIAILFSKCTNKPGALFTEMDKSKTGIDYRNLLVEDETFNGANYLYFYNGAGVAIGDINNDGLPDVFFAGNMVKNRLYLNKGNFKFENITDQSHVAEKQGWCTGASMVDINNDGKLDIYVCRSADGDSTKRKNLLFINNGDLTFTEAAEQYGLADDGYTTQATFFDYDKDGDLDCFVLNHSEARYSVDFAENPEIRKIKNPDFASRLYRNDNGHFIDISEQAGITSNVLCFGLGVAVSDFNNDGWPDMYVSHDFQEPDYLYMNNKDGSFTESFGKCMDQGTLNSMGNDAADFNNDGLTDMVTMDMLAEENYLQKVHSSGNNFDKTSRYIANGFQPQYMRNMLQKNNGDGTFSEIGQIAGVSNTDWSWAALFCDFDGDMNKDLFVANGYLKDYSDLDFINFLADRVNKKKKGEAQNIGSYKETLDAMPEIKIPNYIFKNTGQETFANKTKDWGLEKPSVSYGAAYADLDNDGDMDLVLNNTNEYADVYRNNLSASAKNNFIRISLDGPQQNKNGIGAKVKVFAVGKEQLQEQFPVRGYESSVDFVLNFGLDSIKTIDSIQVIWPDDKYQVLHNVPANQTVKIKYADTGNTYKYASPLSNTIFTSTTLENIVHRENVFNDFTVQTLLPSYLSRQGPCIARGDINGDGLEDIFIGKGKGFASQLFIQTSSGGFSPVANAYFATHTGAEITGAEFFDADGDGDLDLYTAHGGYEFSEADSLFQDELLLNDGKGIFLPKPSGLPSLLFSKSCAKAADIDGDGDMDLFVGGRVIPGRYPIAPPSKILLNDGKGNFTDTSKTLLPSLGTLGMVTDAAWTDINNDKKPDLIVVGEWMPIKVFINKGNGFANASDQYIHFDSHGWWNRVALADMDNDGDQDVILGNVGLNTQFHTTEKEPIQVTYNDFDKNGSVDPILSYFIKGVCYPSPSRDELAEQLPFMKKKYLSYKNYANTAMEDLFTAEQMKGSQTLKASMMETIYLENKGNELVLHHLPQQAQYAPVYGIVAEDINGDGKKDILLAGNNIWSMIKFGRYTANHGVLLLGDGKAGFKYVPQYESGLKIAGNVRSAALIGKGKILLGVNDAPLQLLQFK